MKDVRIAQLAVLAGLTWAAAGYAADAPLEVEEIVVTAQKRAQSLQDVPMAVSAMDATAMDNAGVQTMNDLSRQIPVLEVQENSAPVATDYRIRRVGNLGNIPDFEPSVGVFIDGAFRARSVFGTGDLFDLDRVEVLRGPQSTLYGKNTSAGVIGIYTAEPANEFEWRGESDFGAIDGANDAPMANFKGGISGPLSDSVRGSLGMSYAVHDTTMDQALVGGGGDANDLERYAMRSQLAWDATEELSFRAILGTAQQHDNKQMTEDLHYDPNGYVAGIVLPTFEAAGVSQACTNNDGHDRTSCRRNAVKSDVDSWEGTLLASYSLDNGWTVNSISSWDYFKYEGTDDDVAQVAAPVLRYHDTQENTAWQQELRLTSAGGETVDWLGGMFYYQSELKRGDGGNRPMFLFDQLSDDPTVADLNQALLGTPFPVPFATQGQVGYLDSKSSTQYIGVYGQATWNVTDDVAIAGGVRWQREEKDADIRQSVNDPAPSVISLLLTPPDVSQNGLNRDTDAVTWTITPQWTVAEHTMLYATVTSGFKSGGFNTGFGSLPIASREFDDEKVMNYESGIKTELWDRRVRLNANVFYAMYKDYQDAAFVGAQFTVGNAQRTELKGAELEGSVLLSENFTADFAISYADLTYDRYTSGQCYPGRVPDDPANGSCDLSGEHPVDAPEWRTHLGLIYDRPVSWGDVYARIDWTHTSEYNTSFSADPLLEQDAYSWVNLRMGSKWQDYEFVVWMDNVTDESVAMFDAVQNFYTGDQSYQSFIDAPRSVGVTLRVNY